MLFNSFIFLFAFLPITYAVFWALRSAGPRYVWLTITGYIFYGWWDWRFCFLMAFSTAVAYTAGLGFLRLGPNDPRRRWCLWVPIGIDLSLLGFFKYANFAAESAAGLIHLTGVDVAIPHLDVILPIGISFYTFHTISYIVDSYRGVVKPTRNFFEFAAYVSLFSQLVAGPIVRFRQLEEDLEALGTADRTRGIPDGIRLFVLGLMEKLVLADTLGAIADPLLAQHQQLASSGAWAGMLAYTFQLYFDFSGYSSMAMGLGLLFGLRIPQNFNSPYKATDPSDFWRRWHISLSTCIRDYIYIPLGGSRGTPARTNVNLLAAMAIGGLWHGAAWTFVLWGVYHGVLLVVHRLFAAAWDPLPVVFRRGVMFLAAVIGWTLFRATSMEMALDLLHRLAVPTAGIGVDAPLRVVGVIGVAAGWAMLGPNPVEWRPRWTFATQLLFAALFGLALALIAGGRASPFLYFQF